MRTISYHRDYTLLLIKMQGECDDIGKHMRGRGYMNHSLEAYSCAVSSSQVRCDAINRGATSPGGCALRAKSLMHPELTDFNGGGARPDLPGSIIACGAAIGPVREPAHAVQLPAST